MGGISLGGGVPCGSQDVRGGVSFSLELQVSLLYTFSHENLMEYSRGFYGLPCASMGFHDVPWFPQDYVS